ncbi:MAG: NAD(P)/FAD-dependent oxidoreductase [Robiginitomaculum sp.]|nr:NAD(P)/FAD-dependent oxidoreductase [Robiginitomaculum sp.]MDQ7077174.1 NAD(P)/FAD-dependent oxidoreductase [Robiginitomaculum sp.]
MTRKSENNVLEVAIIGAGFSGIGMGIGLKRAGIDRFIIFEKTDGLSGTWHDNTYPGAGCDVPSHLYCYSFAPNPDWGHVYSRQPEIKAYVESCAQRYGITGHIQLNTAVKDLRFDEQTGLWIVRTAKGDQVQARFVVTATGPLSVPLIPPIKGLNDFEGKAFHSARWPKNLSLKGKNVAIIGSAASTVQIAPAIADEVENLSIFQRTANYIVPRRDRAYRPWEKALWRRFPFLLKIKRIYMDLVRDYFSFRMFYKNSRLAKFMARGAIKSMHEIVHDPELRAKLTPNYTLGCKRILLSDDYYQTLLRGNVALVTDGIDRVEKNAIITKTGQDVPADVIVLATGFEATNFLAGLKVTGLGGRDLHERFSQRMSAYRGSSYAGFPNLFTLLGPNTGLGHTSIILMIKAQIDYVLKAINHAGTAVLNVREDAEKRYNETIADDLENMVWASGCHSWYQAKDGSIPTLWPHSTAVFRRQMARPDFTDYEIL